MARNFAIFVLSLTAMCGGSALADMVLDVPTRPGVHVRLGIVLPDQPRAVAVLFAGGSGTLRISQAGHIGRPGNALIRGRSHFADRGLVTAAIDAPSDQLSAYGKMPDQFRTDAAHVRDLRAVIHALRKRYQLPVWLIGTSRGSTSVAHAAIHLGRPPVGPDGIVLSSSIGVDHRRGGNLLSMDLAAIGGPVAVVHHKSDNCLVTPYSGAEDIRDALQAADPLKFMEITGGKAGKDPCGPVSHHGFRGQRAKVFKHIANWILAN